MPETKPARPLPVLIIGWLFIAVGVLGFAYHIAELDLRHPFENDVLPAGVIRLLAILGGTYVLSGRNWARWLVIAWIAYHTILSTFHSLAEAVIHSLLLVVIAYFLFRPNATAYFKPASS